MYRKTYFCVCEGQQEEMYLKHIAFLLKKFPERVVTFNTHMQQYHSIAEQIRDLKLKKLKWVLYFIPFLGAKYRWL